MLHWYLVKKNNVKGKNFDHKSSSSTEQLVTSQESESFVKDDFMFLVIANRTNLKGFFAFKEIKM